MRLLPAALLTAAVLAAPAPALAVPSQLIDCQAPAGEAEPGTQEFQQRDFANMLCATERIDDMEGNPAFAAAFAQETPGKFADQHVAMLTEDTTDPHLTLAQFVPGGSTTDPYRTLTRWEASGRGQVEEISFRATNGAKLNGHIFLPPEGVTGRLPGVVITTGSIQGYQEMYYWAAEGLAEAGYQVMTYDVQGQGNSGTFPAMENCTSIDTCSGVPFQQSYNFFQGTEDALNFFFSDANPGRDRLDPGRVGIAGHSLGASAVSTVGQCDRRVKAIVAWDNLAPAGDCTQGGTISGYPQGTPDQPRNDVPALGLSAEYFFNPTPMQDAPDPHAKWAGFEALRAAGTDTMELTLRSSTHLEWTYVPYILPASRLGERVSMHYTLAWFDRYLKGDESATERLTTTTFDDSADASSIGAGTFELPATNVPYKIEGLPVADRLSIYYASAYDLGDEVCEDMRAGC
jgi:dienelactone hydrolase